MPSYEVNHLNKFVLPAELTRMAFRFLLLSGARGTLVRCLRVCRLWYTIAIGVMWAHIDLDWFRLLGPIASTAGFYETTLSIIGNPTVTKWDLFSKFTKETRSLDFLWNGRPGTLDTFFLDEIAYFRDDSPIFPKLNSLRAGIKSFVISFYPRHLKKLSLDFGFHPVDDYLLYRASRSLSFASHRFNNLTSLDIRSATVLEQPLFSRALEECLTEWDSLVSFSGPLYFLRDRELLILGRYRHLTRVGVDVEGAQRGLWMSEGRVRTHHRIYLDHTAFIQLRCLELGTGLPTLLSLLSPLHVVLSRLETLWVRVPHPQQCQPSHLHDLLELLANHSPHLRRLTLRLAAAHTWDHSSDGEIQIVEWWHIQSLTRMRLEVIDLSYTVPFLITDADVTELASSQPHVISIMLNAQPIFVHSSHLTFASIESFARFCPKLQSLAIYIDAETSIPRALPTSRFNSLEHLRMGHSSILEGDIEDYGRWIQLTASFYHTLPPTAKIWSTWYDQRHDMLDCFPFIEQRHHPHDLCTYGKRWKSLFLCTRPIPPGQNENA